MECDPKGDNVSTFEYLWEKIDRNYSLFDVKEVDWDSIHRVYRPMAEKAEDEQELFAVLGEMLNSLDDGHVNLISPFDISRSEELFLVSKGRCNVDWNVVMLNYLRYNHHTRGGLSYNAIDDGKVLYARYTSFSNSATRYDIHAMMNDYDTCRGMIIDVRQNGGGTIDNIWHWLKAFPSHGELLYRTQIKSGPGHDDFSPLEEMRAPKNEDYPAYSKPVVVLTDRGSYSATSIFALCCKQYKNVTIVGDTTGGGLGVPTNGTLPNGWYYRHSITRTIAPDGKNYENGVPPDIVVMLQPAATKAGRDNVIDSACAIIAEQER